MNINNTPGMRQFKRIKCRWFFIWFDLIWFIQSLWNISRSHWIRLLFQVARASRIDKDRMFDYHLNHFTHLWMEFHYENRFFRTWFERCSNQSSRWFYGMSFNRLLFFSWIIQWLFLVSVLDIINMTNFCGLYTSTIYFINNYKIRSHENQIRYDPVCQHSLSFIIIIMIFTSVRAGWSAAEFVKPVKTRFGKNVEFW